MSSVIVTAIVCHIRNGVPQTLTQRSAQLFGTGSTTITGASKAGHSNFTVMTEVIQHRLGIKRAQIIKERHLVNFGERTSHECQWYFMLLEEGIVVPSGTSEIYEWNDPEQLLHVMRYMSEDWRHMFIQALAVVCDDGILERSNFSFLPPPRLKKEQQLELEFIQPQ